MNRPAANLLLRTNVTLMRSLRRSKATLLDGNAIADKILDDLKQEVDKLDTIGIMPVLAPIVVGSHPESQIYLRKKYEAARKIGLRVRVEKVDQDVKFFDLMRLIQNLNDDEGVHGVLVQLPLPDHLPEAEICNAVDPSKDVDGFTRENLGALVQADQSKLSTRNFLPCTARAVESILRSLEEAGKRDLSGGRAVVLGRSLNVGLPISLVLQADRNKGGFDLTTTVCNRMTKNLGDLVKSADLVVSAAGVPGLITPEMLKEDAIVIDVGLTRTAGNKVLGDVREDVKEMDGVTLTPVPGGVGPCTVASLMCNTVLAARRTAIRWSV